jgi:hypothetical protein
MGILSFDDFNRAWKSLFDNITIEQRQHIEYSLYKEFNGIKKLNFLDFKYRGAVGTITRRGMYEDHRREYWYRELLRLKLEMI